MLSRYRRRPTIASMMDEQARAASPGGVGDDREVAREEQRLEARGEIGSARSPGQQHHLQRNRSSAAVLTTSRPRPGAPSMARRARFPCPEGKADCAVHDTAEKEWHDLNFFQHEAYLHARVPRIRCVPSYPIRRRLTILVAAPTGGDPIAPRSRGR